MRTQASGASATYELETWFSCPIHGKIKNYTNMSDHHPWKCPACGEILIPTNIWRMI